MSGMLSAILALISAIIAVFSFLQYQKTAETLYLIGTLIFLLAALGLGAMFLSGRVNKTDDIHITE
ncbi:MAG: hypothetical protein H0W58_11090 [Acidobacteria bacterium]|jgi:hypothetical protein|nr:hypothetical protein [Acidobacteriota bacterium]